MSKPAQLEPAWLIGLLMAWSRRSSRNNGLGYPEECIYLKERTGNPARSYEPTGYSGVEIDTIDAHVKSLRMMRKLSVMRYCKPWMCNAIDNELGKTYDTDTWLYHLKGALAELVQLMDGNRRTVAVFEAELK